MTAHIVSVSPEVYIKLSSQLVPEIRCADTEHFPPPHFWMYAPDGSVVVFTCVPIETLESRKVEGILDGS